MSVADILQQMAQNAGRAQLARGALLGNAVADISLVPGQIVNDRERQRIFDDQRSRQAAQDARQVAADQREAGAAHRKEQDVLDERAVMGAYFAGSAGDPTKYDLQAAATKAQQIGREDLIPHLLEFHAAQQPKVGEAAAGTEGRYLTGPNAGQLVPNSRVPDKPTAPTVASLDAEQQRILAKPESTRTPDEVASMNAYIARRAPTPAPPSVGSLADYLTRTAREKGKTVGDLTTREIAAATKQHADATQKTPAAGEMGTIDAVDLEKLPQPVRDQAQALVDGRRQLDPRLASKPLGQTIINAAYAIDPTFDQGNYNARYKARTDLTNPGGTGGKTIGALNTAIQHAGKLSDLIETLDNYESPLANAVVNPLRTATGSTAVTNFDTVAPQLAKEIERVWRGAGGTAGEIHDLIETIGHNKGKQQQREALQQFVDLAKGKLDSLEQQRDNVMGKTAGATIPILFESNKPIIDTIAQRASGKTLISVTDPVGGVHQFATQAAADAFKKAAGIK